MEGRAVDPVGPCSSGRQLGIHTYRVDSMSDALDMLLNEGATDSDRLALELAREDVHLLERLVCARRDQHLTQGQVAARMGVSQATVSAFERLGNDPHLSTIRRYAWAVGVMVRHHVDDDGAPLPSDSQEMWHVSGSSITARPTAAARARSREVDKAWHEAKESTFRKVAAGAGILP